MAYQSRAGSFLIRLYLIFLHIGKNCFQNLLIDLCSQKAICVWNNGMGSACIKAGNNFPVFIFPYRKLCLVSVTPWSFHANDLLNADIFKTPDSFQIALYLIFLKFQLLFIGQELKLTASTGSGIRTAGFYPVFRRFQNLHQAGISIVLLGFHDFCLYLIPDYRVLHKERIALCLANALSVMPHIFYVKSNHIIFLKFHERFLPAHNLLF